MFSVPQDREVELRALRAARAGSCRRTEHRAVARALRSVATARLRDASLTSHLVQLLRGTAENAPACVRFKSPLTTREWEVLDLIWPANPRVRSRGSCSSPRTPCTATPRASCESSACTPGSRPLRSRPVAPAEAPSGPAEYTPALMRVGIVGLGYVGLPLAVAFAAADVDVLGVDVDARKIDAIAAGHSYIEDVPDGALAAAAGRSRPPATTHGSPRLTRS